MRYSSHLEYNCLSSCQNWGEFAHNSERKVKLWESCNADCSLLFVTLFPTADNYVWKYFYLFGYKDSIVWELGRQVYLCPLSHVKYYKSGSGLYLACFSLINNDFVRKLILIHNKQKFVLRGKWSICAIKWKIKPNKVFIFSLKCTMNTW